MELGPFEDAAGYAQAVAADDVNPLAGGRSRFAVPDPQLLYLDGNSLGRLPADTPALVDDVVRRQWGDRLIRSCGDTRDCWVPTRVQRSSGVGDLSVTGSSSQASRP